MPYHIARKKVAHSGTNGVLPERENAIKFELFIFDALPLAERWTVVKRSLPVDEASYLVGIVTRGEGRVSVERGGSLDVAVGSTFAVPAAGLRGLRIEASNLELIACRPPAPSDLDVGASSGR